MEITSHKLIFENRPAELILANDVTERLVAEDALRRSEALFHSIFRNVPVAITISSMDQSHLLDFNDHFMTLVGYERSELLTSPLRALQLWVPPPDPARFREEIARDGQIAPREVQWRTKDGQLLDVLVSAQQIELGHMVCILGIGIDITERKRVEEQQIEAERVRLQVEQTRQVVALKEQFISRMSHEFRTPLAIVLSSKEALQHYYHRLSEQRRQEHFNEIDKQTRYIIELLDAVLTIGQVKAGKLQCQPAPLDLVAFARKLFDQIQITDQQRHRFEFEAQGNFDGAHLDERLLQHIFVNLLTNAVKYTPADGEIRFELAQVKGRVRCRISDQGIGMTPEDVERLGETFFRADNARRFSGTGLGLSIVKESVAAQGGTLSCESRLNEGTTFTVDLPLQCPGPGDRERTV